MHKQLRSRTGAPIRSLFQPHQAAFPRRSKSLLRQAGSVTCIHSTSAGGLDANVRSRQRLSQLWIPSLVARKPQDFGQADANDLLLRCGFIHQAYPGFFGLLPLGLRVQDKLEKLLDKHMATLKASKVSLSSFSSAALWRQTGRYDKVQKELFKLTDREDNEFILAPTHEEEITSMARSLIASSKDLPLRLYQISRKYRDEIRTREGLLRAREFLMKDLYTFDHGIESAQSCYNEVLVAYNNFFHELGLPYLMVKAATGAMGGSLSHEFQMLSTKGEDRLLVCDACTYAANEEVVRSSSDGSILSATDSTASASSLDTQAADRPACPECKQGLLYEKRAIELGHTFLLGTRYSDPLDLTLPSGGPDATRNHDAESASGGDVMTGMTKQPVQMGCHGIGVSRLIAAVADAYKHKQGLEWPLIIAPHEVVIIAKEGLQEASALIYDTLQQSGHVNDGTVDCAIDDRQHGFVKKIKDAEIIGWPIVILLGRVWEEKGQVVEVRARMLGLKQEVHLDDLASFVANLRASLLMTRATSPTV